MSFTDKIFIRDVQPSDHPFILKWENDPLNWAVSETKKEYTFEEIQALIASAVNFNESNQKRWVISTMDQRPIGTIDVFQGDFKKGEVGIGVLIADEMDRKKGFAQQAVLQVIDRCIIDYNLYNFFADVHDTNQASKALFIKCGFEPVTQVNDSANFDFQNSTIIRLMLCVKK